MKQALKLSLAISLALGAGQVFAIGLGQIQVKSRLNQPLDAEIPVIVDRRGEAESLVVKLASAEEFSRVGMERSQLGVPLQFALGQSARGETVIKVTSTEAVRAPFLDFLLEANWSNGRVLREYTVLLDPPLTTPASAPSAVAAEPIQRPAVAPPPPRPIAAEPAEPVAKSEPAAAPVQPARPTPVPAPAAAPPARIAKADPATPPAAVAAPAAKPAAPAKPSARPLPPSVAASNGSNYGPVAEGETLWEIAQATLPDDGVSANQLMLALLKANPDAFVRNNINQLKRGAILRIPSGDEVRAVGSMRAAAAQVQAQVAEWRGESARPTLLAGNAATATPVVGTAPSSSPRKADDRLALVPPEMGKDGLASTGQAGSSAGAAGGNASAAELARANESLATQAREAGELRTRVKDLESLQSKNDRLISLKDSEIADLQRKLAAAQAAAASTSSAATTKGESPVATAVEPAVVPTASSAAAKEDIWGKPTSSAAAVPIQPEAVPDPVAATPSTGQAASASSAASTGSVASSAIEPANPGSSDASSSSSVATTASPAAGSNPEATVPPVAAAADPGVAAPVAGVETTPIVTPPAEAAVAPADETPWYLDPRILGGAGILALLAGFLALRSRRKPAAEARPSLADKFAAGGVVAIPVVAQAADGAIVNDEETQLREQIAFKPDDLGARLELLSIYYADNRVDEFREGAEDMQPYVDNPREPEWVQVRAMGEDLLPNDPLFSAATSDSSRISAAEQARWDEENAPIVIDDINEPRWADVEPVVAPVTATVASTRFDDEQRYAPVRASEPVAAVADPDVRDVEAELAGLDYRANDDGIELSFDDDFVDEAVPEALPVSSPAPVVASGRPLTEFASEKKAESFGFDLPPLDFDMEFSKPQPAVTPAVTPAASLADEALDSDDEFFVGEDALGTKLDLARAYADMGDPDGARAMLEEVIAEGDSAQQEQARKLLLELG